jgi:hypothetical protein
MTNLKKRNENLEWFLVLISPISFGVLIVIALYILSCICFSISLDECQFLFIPIYAIYTFIWGKFFKSVSGQSWLD